MASSSRQIENNFTIDNYFKPKKTLKLQEIDYSIDKSENKWSQQNEEFKSNDLIVANQINLIPPVQEKKNTINNPNWANGILWCFDLRWLIRLPLSAFNLKLLPHNCKSPVSNLNFKQQFWSHISFHIILG